MNSTYNSQYIILGDLLGPDLLDSSGYFPDGGFTDDEESFGDGSVDPCDDGDVSDCEEFRIPTYIFIR